jgi:hypothetical protein
MLHLYINVVDSIYEEAVKPVGNRLANQLTNYMGTIQQVLKMAGGPNGGLPHISRMLVMRRYKARK